MGEQVGKHKTLVTEYMVLLSVTFLDDQLGYIVGSDGTILKTTDGGSNWATQISPYNHHLESVFFIDDQIGFAVGGKSYPGNWIEGTILKTSDGGVNWNQILGGTIQFSSVYFVDSATGWVVGQGGTILKTTNCGNSWSSQQSGTLEYLLSVNFVNNTTGWVVGGGGTILKTTNGGVTFIEEEQDDEVPTTYSLSQNFPNPFNPSTKIQYSVISTQKVTLKVYDVLGNEIATLVNEEKPAREYEVEFNTAKLPSRQGSALTSGIYFYQLRVYPAEGGAGQFVETKKMVLLK